MDEEEMKGSLREMKRKCEAIIERIDTLLEQPPETPPAPQIDAKRLDRIWKCLQEWMSGPTHEELSAFAKKVFGYSYYVSGKKYPVDLRPAVCDKLNTFTDEQLTELEKIVEAVH